MQVRIYTRLSDIEELLPEAKKAFDERDERLGGMTDESTDTFYSCLLCQSFAPNHVCVITPERLGLCGSISWLDAKASYEINPTGPNQPIPKGEFLDERLGQWKSTNDFVYQRSNKSVEKVSMYSLMDSPQTSCVVSDTQVVIDDEVLNIGDFIDKHRGGEDYAKSQALTLNKGKSISEKIVAMQRFELPNSKNKLFKVATKSGAEIILTPKHKLAIDRPEGLKWIKAVHLKKGDRVISLKKLDIKERIPDIRNFMPENFSAQAECSHLIKKELFYLMGLIASDGSVFRRGNYEYNIYFINTRKELIDEYEKLYKAIFPQKKLHVGIKKPSKHSFIRGRRINSAKDCYVCYSNNSVLGILLDFFGVIPKKENQCFRNLLSLPKEYIASFLTGLFDGDGSVRLRKYKNIWDIAEAYFCTRAKRSANYLVWLLKRFGILSNVRKSDSVYKIIMHGNNIYELSKIIKPVHKTKAETMKKIQSVYSKKRLDKTQSQVLPFSAAKILTNISGSRSILSPTTYFYYKTFRSRPVLGNIEKVMAKSSPKEAKLLKSLLDSDFYLDIVREVKQVKANGRFVYNLTLSDNHCYFANQMLIKNCGCFECIVAIIPEANGFMIVHRDYTGMTPCGMTFTTLAGSVGGGIQSPGFLGVGKLYIVSKKFISAEGGLKRVVWMPKELKELLGDRLKRRAQDLGEPDLIDKIADETQATTQEELLSFLEKANHPALAMPPLL
ncbi:MAG: LAGLIDADG family homing endonuclease [Candidatus Omnitrophota bacterium]|nr:LAGLIDADG family homing endonuclease [Candidatus Omnitrophota bacterium]